MVALSSPALDDDVLSPVSTAPHFDLALAEAPKAAVEATPERISVLADQLLQRIQGSIAEIESINLQARLLSINAQIEAGRAGEAGRTFGVVGREMVLLSERTQQAARTIETQAEVLVRELASISRELATSVRGTRLTDLAYTNIDLIDRNLYERTCDCRWWATDAAVVQALQSPSREATAHLRHRLGVILKAYTVYFDIVVADLRGTIIANGRPGTFSSTGSNHATAPWFTSALATASGDEFGFQSAHRSPLAGDQRALVYSCKVCREGDAQSEPLGVLGVVFNWDALAQKVVEATPIEDGKRERSQVCITDSTGSVLATTAALMGETRLNLPDHTALLTSTKGTTVINGSRGRFLVAHAASPGFETYRTGWHSFIIERLDR